MTLFHCLWIEFDAEEKNRSTVSRCLYALIGLLILRIYFSLLMWQAISSPLQGRSFFKMFVRIWLDFTQLGFCSRKFLLGQWLIKILKTQAVFIKYNLISLELRSRVRRNQALGLIIPGLIDTQKCHLFPTIEISRKWLLDWKLKNVEFEAGRLGFGLGPTPRSLWGGTDYIISSSFSNLILKNVTVSLI